MNLYSFFACDRFSVAFTLTIYVLPKDVFCFDVVRFRGRFFFVVRFRGRFSSALLSISALVRPSFFGGGLIASLRCWASMPCSGGGVEG